MKKILPLLLCFAVIISAFVGCSSKDNKNAETTTENISQLTTDEAKIKEADAINLIQSYTKEELGLTDEEMKSCSFMVASAGVKENDVNCIKVIATIKQKHVDSDTGKETYTFDTKGEYYISYDGKKVFRKDISTGAYTDMKVKAVPTTVSIDE